MTRSGFARAGLTTVLLPSGFRCRGTIPGIDVLAARGLLDNDVANAAIRLGDKSWLGAADDKDIAEELQLYVDALVVGFPREALDPGADPDTGEWLPVDLTRADLETMDQRDRDLLEDLCLHRRTAADITTLSEVVLGISDAEVPDDDIARLERFRVDGHGVAGHANGAGVGLSPVGVAGDG